MMTRHLSAAALLVGLASASGGARAADDAQVARGAYIARAGDCVACHTATGGAPFAGGLAIETPMGRIYSTNITPDPETGIGTYDFAAFDRAVRGGVNQAGHRLYPAMPYPSYARVTPDDMQALYAYFMHGVKPQHQPDRAADIPWPLSMRWPLMFWDAMFAPSPATVPAAASGSADQLARGRYLVVGLEHCGSCHTPRGFALQEKALTDADGAAYLSGAPIDGWLAKSLRSDGPDGLSAWSVQDIVTFLKTGRNNQVAAFGGMKDVVAHSTQYLNDDDLTAIALYLKSLGGKGGAAPALRPDAAAATALRTGHGLPRGGRVFLDNCAACHRTGGQGYDGVFPRLALSSVVNSADPMSLVRIVLEGSRMAPTAGAPAAFGMPGLGWRLDDRDVADVVTFIRTSWGNHGAPVSAQDVARIRRTINSGPTPESRNTVDPSPS
ncbi:cytochrome c [Gluconacetobacter azotocaptans]|uniref:Cytochrome c n=3 Tax=Gluconacetobacter azotocaptans TaxID=142834 RepID=A0A7W4PBW0_9PROT|nr:cytochrome c [Gluconacetobacter azotocaptans]